MVVSNAVRIASVVGTKDVLASVINKLRFSANPNNSYEYTKLMHQDIEKSAAVLFFQSASVVVHVSFIQKALGLRRVLLALFEVTNASQKNIKVNNNGAAKLDYCDQKLQ